MSEHEALERRAQSGDTAAQIALGRRFAAEGQVLPARSWYARAAEGGNRDALRELGASLLERPPFMLRDGVRFVHNAAQQGDAAALRICAALAAQDDGNAKHWDVALDFLLRAAQQGSDKSRTELRHLARDDASEDWAGLRARVDIESWLPEKAVTAIHDDPAIAVIESFASPQMCDWLVAESLDRLTRAKVYARDAGPNRIEEVRTSSETGFDVTRWGLPVSFLRARIARLTGRIDQQSSRTPPCFATTPASNTSRIAISSIPPHRDCSARSQQRASAWRPSSSISTRNMKAGRPSS